jgi:hypothetical protein
MTSIVIIWKNGKTKIFVIENTLPLEMSLREKGEEINIGSRHASRGLCIGSGAIESAQRTILQERMKRAGQRWSEDRAQNILNLKVASRSQMWAKVVNINTKYKKAA